MIFYHFWTYLDGISEIPTSEGRNGEHESDITLKNKNEYINKHENVTDNIHLL